MKWYCVVILVTLVTSPGLARRRVNRAFLKMFQEEALQSDPCHDDETDKPKQCVPDFVNAAYGIPVTSTSTCGSPPTRHCYAAPSGPFLRKGFKTKSCQIFFFPEKLSGISISNLLPTTFTKALFELMP